MSKLYIFEIASVLIGVLLVVADCRHMVTDPPEAPQRVAGQRTADMAYPFTAQGAQMQGADVIRELNDLSLLASAGAARSQTIAR